jgi:non-specific serine/threonine protein kinase
MLETIREFALDQLTTAAGDVLRDRNLTYFVGVAEAEEGQERGVDQAAWVLRLAADRDNFRAALAYAQARPDAERFLRLAAALERRFWLASGDHDLGESRRWLEAGLEMGGAAAPGLRAKALLKIAWTVEGSPSRMLAVLEEGLSEYERAGDDAGMTEALSGLGLIAIHTGDTELADTSLHRGLALARRIHVRPQVLVELLAALGLLAHLRREYAVASAHLDEALAVARRSGDTWGIAFALDHIGRLALSEGNAEGATSPLLESADLARAAGDTEQWAEAALFLSTAWISQGALDGARSLIREVALMTGDLNFWHQLMTLDATGEWLGAAAAHPGAVTCIAAAARARADHEHTIETDWEAARRPLLERLQRDMPGVEFEAAWAAGRAVNLADALEQGVRTMEAVHVKASADSILAPPDRHDLSRRELEVLALVSAGRSDGEIAERLFISKKTASVHVAHIKDKVGADSRIEVALAGIRLGLLKPSLDDSDIPSAAT